MLRNVAAVVLDGVEPFELGVVCEVFGTDRSDDGLPVYDFAVVAGEPGPLRTSQGFTLSTPHGLDRLATADLIAVPALSGSRVTRPSQLPAPLLAELRRGVDRGARVLSVCNGAFVLGAAGLLDDRRCTTHWHQTDTLARLFPAAKVDPDVLYVDDDPVFTSAGTAAGIDACLYLVRKEHGSKVANAIARRMVDTLKDVMSWLVRHLELPVTVDDLARRAAMSPRTFARRFVQETGTTPQRWLTSQRILLAQELLEETDATIEAVAARSGFGNATALRHHFRIWRSTTPQAYRRQFRGPPHRSLPSTVAR